MDPNNPVVKLCAAGISEEMAGRRGEAAKLYLDTWSSRTSDYEACIAAHYVARLQSTPEDVLRWNSEALRFAESANDSELRGFFPSLYLNLGKSYEDLKNLADAKKFTADDPHLVAMERMSRDGPLSHTARIPLNFALAKAYDDIGRFDDAFRHLQEGNRQKRSRIGNVRSVANCSGLRKAPASPTSPKSITSPSRLLLQNRQTGSSGSCVAMIWISPDLVILVPRRQCSDSGQIAK